jgi:hypothetical protein
MAAYHELSVANGLVRGMSIEVVFKLRLCRLDFFCFFLYQGKKESIELLPLLFGFAPFCFASAKAKEDKCISLPNTIFYLSTCRKNKALFCNFIPCML